MLELNSEDFIRQFMANITLEIEQSVASHHLNILREKGALDSQRTGRNTFYFLKHEKLNTDIECIGQCA